jgi:hypothetical protein
MKNCIWEIIKVSLFLLIQNTKFFIGFVIYLYIKTDTMASIFDIDNHITGEWLIQNGWEKRKVYSVFKRDNSVEFYLLKMWVKSSTNIHRSIQVWFHFDPYLNEISFTNDSDEEVVKVEICADINTYIQNILRKHNYEYTGL